ncbi:3-hydroxyacyl-CoA dehydrogenase NAD-binding domain-containing protein [Phreatobacter sp.]|uniref:3-hydroxyacyl-CoA dehydrogenase NAD-binding domain-containing protein n=1 Tax=Phreatobacter sp. TaxID=1966341 RepID=UPI0025E4EB87|nr:3-hydroxyacyl-CoA dehydrogenase NAD-binding domain-containing protein [Phreatobacter sp.]
MNEVVDLATEGQVAVVTVNSPPVNALSANVRTGIAEAVQKAGADAAVKAIVIHCAGRTFIAGADITEFGKPPKGVPLGEVNAILEASPKPIVAAIHGTALGGGLELALSCHYRVAVPSAKLGLPEVKLGLVPGAGGTQRLPRLVGVERALEAIAFGEPMKASEAASHGLVDAVTSEQSLRADAIVFANQLIAENAPLKKVRDRSEKLGAGKEVFAAFRKANARKFRGFEAPEACIQCVEAAVNMPFDEGLVFERDTIMRLMPGVQSRAQRYAFFAERQANKIPDVPETTPTRKIAKVGMIGAGTMGGGIAMNFINAGIPVTIVETKQEALDRGLGVIRKNYENTAKRGRLTMADVETRMARFTPTLDLSALADCDLIIEAVFENMEIKKEVFAKLDGIAKKGAILATNTSYLDVDQIAAMTKRPEDVIGMHFFSPANVMRLLEVVRGEKTAKDVIATAMGLAKTIGKVAVLVGVCHGFVGNRMLAQRQREANKLILEGAMPWDVDRVLYDFGLPMGPFAMSDLAGLDIGWSRETSKGETPRELLCEMDRRGQKTGAGFYDYDENRVAKPSEVTEKIILDLAAKKGINRRPISDEEILQRCIYPMINEGAKILEEGKAIRASDIDTVWINGYGWPVYRGGPMFYGDTVGLPEVLKVMQEFEGRHGADFKPSALLEKLAAEGKGFKDL